LLVAAGAGIATGLGAPSATGLLFALGALAGEVAFTLLAVPLLPKLGPIRLSAYVSALATPMLLGAGLIANGKGAVPLPSPKEAAAICYLAVAVSAGGFFLIYSALPRLGAAPQLSQTRTGAPCGERTIRGRGHRVVRRRRTFRGYTAQTRRVNFITQCEL
jgi:drug/metabolite transporter (DMT)-like permease